MMDFSIALQNVKRGHKIWRDGWNGPDQFVFYQSPDANSKMSVPYLYIERPEAVRCPWIPSFGDLMANDWQSEEIPSGESTTS